MDFISYNFEKLKPFPDYPGSNVYENMYLLLFRRQIGYRTLETDLICLGYAFFIIFT